jgi:hypothetical protein
MPHISRIRDDPTEALLQDPTKITTIVMSIDGLIAREAV